MQMNKTIENAYRIKKLEAKVITQDKTIENLLIELENLKKRMDSDVGRRKRRV